MINIPEKEVNFMRKYLAAALQLNSADNKENNLENIKKYVAQAAQKGAKLIAMPECANYEGFNIKQAAENIPDGETFRILSKLAAEYNVWLHCGSIYEKGIDERPYNCTMVINPQGQLMAKYHKMHPFDVELSDGTCVKESDDICPGEEMITVSTEEIGTLGLAICYDIRFGELFRLMALDGAEIFVTPANFTYTTGKDHWETILRTRAIENGCYVIAPCQTGQKCKFKAYGNSMIIDPWGKIIARAGEEEGIIMAEIDLDYVKKVRKQIFTLENRREDIYTLKYNKGE